MILGTDLSLGSAAATTALGIGQSVAGAINLRKDKKELANLARPFAKIQDEYFQNANIAAEQAMSGAPAATKDFIASERRQGLGTGIAALLESGVQPGDVGRLFETYNNSISADAARDAEARTRNIDYFIGVNKDLAGQKTQQFVINELAPYERKLKQLSDKVATDRANIWGGAGTAISGVSAAGTALTNADLLKAFSGKTKPTGVDQGVTITDALGLQNPTPGFNPEMTNATGANNWYQPNSPAPAMPSLSNTAGQALTPDQLQQILDMLKQANLQKE